MTTLRMTVILLTVLVCAGCNHNDSCMLPRQLEGVWTSDDSRYRDRFLELSQVFVIVVTGPRDTPVVSFVDKVESRPMGKDTAFTVYSTDHSQGAHYKLTLQFRPDNGGEIRFKNQPQVWTRRGEATR